MFISNNRAKPGLGVTIMELLVSMAISLLSLTVLFQTLGDSQRMSTANQSMIDSISTSVSALNQIERFFLQKSIGVGVYCQTSGSNVSCDGNAAYCLCDCVADVSTKANTSPIANEMCNTLYIRQKDPLYRTTGYTAGYNRELIIRSTCETAGTATLAQYQFEESCNLNCPRGSRPVTYIQRILDGNVVLDQRIPSMADQELVRTKALGMAFCAERNPGVEALVVHVFGYSFNGDDSDHDIQYFRYSGPGEGASPLFPMTRFLEEQPFSSDSVMVVAE